MTWSDGRAGLNHEQLLLTTSTDGGHQLGGAKGHRGQRRPAALPPPAFSPTGSDVFVVYNAFTTPYRTDTTSPRSLTGVLLHADVTGGVAGPFSEVSRGPSGDPQGTSQNGLTGEFLGDYVYAAASSTFGTAVWNGASNAEPCAATQAYRNFVEGGPPAPVPDVQVSCPATFGNSDIRGVTVPDPTP